MSYDFDIDSLMLLAKFSLPEDEKEEIKERMEFLVRDFAGLSEVSTDAVEPLIHGLELENVLREDKVVMDFDRDTLLSNAPEHEKGYFKVPRTVE